MRCRVIAPVVLLAPAIVSGWLLWTGSDTFDTVSAHLAVTTSVLCALAICALVAEHRRPGGTIAPLLAVAPLLTAFGAGRLFPQTAIAVIGAFAFYAFPLVAGHLLLAYPDGLRDRHRRPVVIVVWVVPALLATGMMLVSGPRQRDGDAVRAVSWVIGAGVDNGERQPNPLAALSSDVAARMLWVFWSVTIVAVATGVAVTLIVRWWRTDRLSRRVAGPLGAAGFAWAISVVAMPILAWPEDAVVHLDRAWVESVLLGEWYSDALYAAPVIGLAALAGVMVWFEILRPRLARTAGGALRLDEVLAGASHLGDALARALGDPTTDLVFADGAGGWIGRTGRRRGLAVEAGRAATVIMRDDEPIAAIDHDRSLLAEPEALDAAAAFAALVIDNERLHVLTLAHLDDVQSSARRLLAATDTARADLDRRLADGPQRLLAAAQDVLVQARRPDDLEQARLLLVQAVGEVREISHALLLTALSEHGLAAGLEDLSIRTEHPIHLVAMPTDPIIGPIATGIYFAVADLTERANGTVSVRVDDRDDGLVVTIGGVTAPLGRSAHDRLDSLSATLAWNGETLIVGVPRPD